MNPKEAVDILLVDDQQSRLLTYEAILGPLGHRLVTATSGVGALQKLMESEFAVILLDVSMPEMDGFETARVIHQHPRFQSTPIIFVTGVHVSELDRLKGYELGAVDYVYVPVVPEILRSKVSVLVELHLQRLELKRLNQSLMEANSQLDSANQRLTHEKASELARFNDRLQQANAELMVSNSALTQEINERRRAEQALIDADRRKDEFLAILGHELRNPLAPIRYAVEILKRVEGPDPILARMRDQIDRQAQHMTRLVDDLLDVARITRGKINLDCKSVDLCTLVKQAVETNLPAIDGRGHRIVVNVPDEPLNVNGDAVRLTQVIGNLVANAAKYTPKGGRIEVNVGTEDGIATIAVRDNGVGIAHEYLTHVFELFGQARNPRPHAHDGLGIGLALVQRLVEMHEGCVEASSDGENRGSEFIVRLPLLHPETVTTEEPMDTTSRSDLPEHRILVVDDDADCREMLAMVLQLGGSEVRTAANGLDALDEAARFEPEIIFLDIRMPGMDGYEVARRLRTSPRGKDLILVALTGWGQDEHREASSAAGFDAHMTKAQEPEAMARMVKSLVMPAPTAADGDGLGTPGQRPARATA
jgi:signal transduction histidine kinase